MSNRPKIQRRSPQTDREIDENLKRAFDQVAHEPIPDRFTNLLNQLRQSEGKKAPGKGKKNDH